VLAGSEVYNVDDTLRKTSSEFGAVTGTRLRSHKYSFILQSFSLSHCLMYK
jgi:hypothetical protein